MTSPHDSTTPDLATGPGPQLGPEWVLGQDGLWFRRGARVILLDPDDRVLMVRAHDLDDPERSWWFTVGGGVDAGETAREAAVREVFEETGLRLSVDDLVGPVLLRSAVFDFLRQPVRQDEEFFLVRLTAADELSRAGWTDIERTFVDEMRWWDLDELAEVRQEVFPVGLVDLVRSLLAGWDGVPQSLHEHP